MARDILQIRPRTDRDPSFCAWPPDVAEAYDQLEVHALMLEDSQRLGSYLAAIRAHDLKAGL